MGHYENIEKGKSSLKLVVLASGGLDSTLMILLAVKQGLNVFPLFVDYGQIAKEKEYRAMRLIFNKMRLPTPAEVDVSGFGKLIPSGLTTHEKDVFLDAFLPNRNLMFMLLGASYACEVGADSVALGLLHEETTIFADQTPSFVKEAERLISHSLDQEINFMLPLGHMSKLDVVGLSKQHGISETYSCHAGEDEPCGVCVACREFEGVED